MTSRGRTSDVGAARRRAMLATAVAAQGAATVVVQRVAFLRPLLHVDQGLSVARAGLLVSLPAVCTMVTLIAWGALADRYGDRLVLGTGLGLAAAATEVDRPLGVASRWPAPRRRVRDPGRPGCSAQDR